MPERLSTTRYYTEKEIKKAIRLIDEEDVSWEEAAAELNRTTASLHIAVAVYKAGSWSNAFAARIKLDSKIIALAEKKYSAREIAEKLKLKKWHVHRVLMHHNVKTVVKPKKSKIPE